MAKKPEKGKDTLPQAPKYVEAIAKFSPHLKTEARPLHPQS